MGVRTGDGGREVTRREDLRRRRARTVRLTAPLFRSVQEYREGRGGTLNEALHELVQLGLDGIDHPPRDGQEEKE